MNLNEVSEENVLLHSNELPKLSMKVKHSVNDFTVDSTELEASGYSFSEAAKGLRFLIRQAQKYQVEKKNDGDS